MSAIDKIRSRVNKAVHFKYPEGERVGVLTERAVVPAGRNPSGARYWNIIDLIQFPDRREPVVRIGYYRQVKGGRLVFAGQTTATFRKSDWKRLFVQASREMGWFRDLLREVASELDSN